MRVEPFTIGNYVHVIKRGARGMPIVKDESEKLRFLKLLFYMNDSYLNIWWDKNTKNLNFFERPKFWPERKPLVNILAFTLLDNHFHLILKEIIENGVSTFMKKIGQSMTVYFNLKHEEKGSLFQGSYKGKVIDTDEYLRYLSIYVMVKNVFEMYPGGNGLKLARVQFDKIWEWAINYKFSSLTNYAKKTDSPILNKEILGEIFSSPKDFKKFSYDFILGRKWEDINSY